MRKEKTLTKQHTPHDLGQFWRSDAAQSRGAMTLWCSLGDGAWQARTWGAVLLMCNAAPCEGSGLVVRFNNEAQWGAWLGVRVSFVKFSAPP
jgi:hypothetical protein